MNKIIATKNFEFFFKIKDAINELICVKLEYYFHNLKIIKQHNKFSKIKYIVRVKFHKVRI